MIFPSRTDIYSLGILFYSMLCGETPFDANNPIDVMQNVLSKRIPPVSSKRMDIPDALSSIIARMTAKNIEDRYHSTSGLKHDLIRIRELLSEGDTEGLKSFQIASKDISCFFNLPLRQFGREKERKIITDVIERVSRRRRQPPHFSKALNSLSSNSSYSDPRMEAALLDDIISDSTSSRGSDSRMNSAPGPTFSHQKSQDSIAQSVQSEAGSIIEETLDTRPHMGSRFSGESRPSNNSINDALSLSRSQQSEGSSLSRTTSNASRFRRKHKCEIVAIGGPTGLGKSHLVRSVQAVARSHGYFASAKFEPTKKAPFEPILRLMSSIFRQIFSEADVATEFHNHLRNFLKNTGIWEVLHSYLELPEWLLSDNTTPQTPQQRDVDMLKESQRRASSPAIHCGKAGHTAEAWLRSGGTSKASRFMNIFIDVLRLLTVHKLCIWSLEDVQFAEPESSELIHRIAAAKIPLILIFTYREEEGLLRDLRSLLPKATRVQLAPFTEAQTAEYVAETLHRDLDYILPLVAVIQEKSRGNIFYIREILETCYRKHCVFYCWR